MVSRAQKWQLVLFAAAALLAFGALMVAFLGVRPWQKDVRYYVLVPDSVEGLEQGAPVKIRGVRVGSVRDFELYPEGREGIRVTLSVRSGLRVHTDAKAFLKLQGLTGLKLIDVLDGTPETPLLPEGSYIDFGETPLQKLTSHADELVERSLAILAGVDRLITHLDTLVEQLDPSRLDASLEQTQQLLSVLTATGRQLHHLVGESRGRIRHVLDQAGTTLGSIDQLAAGLSGAASHLDQAARGVQQLVRTSDRPLSATLYNLREASQSLRELGRTLAQRPSALLFSRPPPERELP